MEEEKNIEVISAEQFRLITTGYYKSDKTYSKYYLNEEGIDVIRIANCKIHGHVVLTQNYLINDKLILNNITFPFGFASNQTTYQNGLIISKCTFKKHVEFFLNSFQSDVNFYDNTFHETHRIISCIFESSFYSARNTYHKTVQNKQSTYLSDILIENDTYDNDFIISQSTIDGKLSLQGHFYGNLEIVSTSCDNFSQIRPSIVLGVLSIVSSSLKELFISKPLAVTETFFVNNLVISGNTPKTLFLFGITINHLSTREAIVNSSSIFTFSNIQLRKMSFINSTIFGSINLISIQGKPFIHGLACKVPLNLKDKGNVIPLPTATASHIELNRCTLGNTTLTDCDLSTFDTFTYRSSKVLDISFIGSKLPTNTNIDFTETELQNESIHRNTQLQLLYSQLKQVFHKQGDLLKATEYYSLEMEARRKKLNSNKTIKNFGERFTLCLNRYSNNHGTSWELALGFTTIVSIILFTCYASSLGFKVDLSWDGFKYFLDIASHIGEFIFPFHRPGFMSDAERGITENGVSRLLDFAGRIFISYGIYQFVQAFRKHGRR